MGLTALPVKAAKAVYGGNEPRPFRWDSTGFQEISVVKKKHTGTQIMAKLRPADVLIGQGKTVPEVCKKIEVSEQIYNRWRQVYGA